MFFQSVGFLREEDLVSSRAMPRRPPRLPTTPTTTDRKKKRVLFFFRFDPTKERSKKKTKADARRNGFGSERVRGSDPLLDPRVDGKDRRSRGERMHDPTCTMLFLFFVLHVFFPTEGRTRTVGVEIVHETKAFTLHANVMERDFVLRWN